MALYWYVAGILSLGFLAFFGLRGQKRPWWHLVLISLFAIWCGVGIGAAIMFYGEGVAKGGHIILAITAGVAIVCLALWRVFGRRAKGTAAAKPQAAKA